MPAPLTIAPLDADTRAEAECRYKATTDADTRLRSQIVLLAHQGDTVRQSTQVVLRRHDMVRRVLQRCRDGGLEAMPRRYAPGGPRTVTAPWEAELRRVIDRDPHPVGVASAPWTTGRVADYLARVTGIALNQETVRLYLHAHDYVGQRPTWTLKRKAAEQPQWVGNACGWRFFWPVP
jgi:transposase